MKASESDLVVNAAVIKSHNFEKFTVGGTEAWPCGESLLLMPESRTSHSAGYEIKISAGVTQEAV